MTRTYLSIPHGASRMGFDALARNTLLRALRMCYGHSMRRAQRLRASASETRLMGNTEIGSKDKAQSAENGRVLFKDCNAVLNHLGGSLRASREAIVRGVAPLGKGMPFPARRALRPTASRLAEPINMAATEY